MESTLRMRAALPLLPFYQERVSGMFNEWLSFMTYPLEAGVTQFVKLDFKTSTTTWVVEHEQTAVLAERYDNFIGQLDFPAVEKQLLKHATQAFQGRFRTWLLMGEAGSQDTGWEILGGPFSLATAFGMIPKNPDSPLLAQWLKQYGFEACTSFGRCIAGNNYSFLNTSIIGNTVSAQIQYYVDCCEALNQTALPDALLELLLEEQPEDLEMSFSFSPLGLVSMGLAWSNPSERIRTLLSSILDPTAQDTLSAYEGTLGSGAEANRLHLYRRASGLSAEIAYEMPA